MFKGVFYLRNPIACNNRIKNRDWSLTATVRNVSGLVCCDLWDELLWYSYQYAVSLLLGKNKMNSRNITFPASIILFVSTTGARS